MTEITREQIEYERKLINEGELTNDDVPILDEICTLALKALEHPTPSQDTVEAVARAIARADGYGDDWQDGYRNLATAAIAAYEARRK